MVLIVLLFPALALGGEVTMKDLEKREGLYYKKFTDVLFTGKVTEKLLRGTFRNGKKDGPWVEYQRNGRLWFKETYKDGKQDGPFVWYHDNGQLLDKGTYKDGKPDGPWVIYHDNGQLKDKGTFKDGKRDGPWVGYNSDGTVWKKYTGTYKDGVKVK